MQIMKNQFDDTTDYVIFTFWVYILHPVSYTMITMILSRKYKTILYILQLLLQLLLQIIFKEFDVLFLQLNQNMTTGCHWVYAFCTLIYLFFNLIYKMCKSFDNQFDLMKEMICKSH